MKHKKLISLLLTALVIMGTAMINKDIGYAAETQWKTEESMPESRVNFQAVADSGKIYLTAGGIAVTAVDIFDVETKTWSKGTNIAKSYNYRSSAIVGKKIYVMGGMTEANVMVGVTDIYNIETGTWSSGAAMPKKAGAASVAVIDNKIYIVGGYSEDGNSYIQIYDTATNSWTVKTMPFSRVYSTCQAYNGKLYLFGGQGSDNTTIFNEVKIYDTAAETWSNGANMPTARYALTSSLVDNSVYVISGVYAKDSQNKNLYTDKVEVYNLESNSWEEGTPILTTRAGAAAIAVDKVIYAFGGGKLGVYFTTAESFDLNPVVLKQLSVLLYRGEETQLSVSNYMIDNRDMIWTSSDPSVATVDADGKITAVSIGLAEITAANADGTYMEMIPVKVAKEEPRLAVHLTSGQKARLFLTDDPSTVTWSSMDTSIAVVSNEGEVTAAGKGLVIIKAELDGEEYHIYVRVNP